MPLRKDLIPRGTTPSAPKGLGAPTGTRPHLNITNKSQFYNHYPGWKIANPTASHVYVLDGKKVSGTQAHYILRRKGYKRSYSTVRNARDARRTRATNSRRVTRSMTATKPSSRRNSRV